MDRNFSERGGNVRGLSVTPEKAPQLLTLQSRFLLAQLYLDSLKDKTSVAEVKAALQELQKQSRGVLTEGDALAQAYSHAMERIDGQLPGLRLLARKILSWITCAQRQLTVLELQHALAINAGDTELDRENLRDIQGMISIVLDWLRSTRKVASSG